MTVMAKKIVEIGGVKMEVDMRTAKVVESYKVGDQIKVLIKEYSDYKSYPGIIVGFDDFAVLPTVVIAYLKVGYAETTLGFVYLNANMKDCEIVPIQEHEIMFDKSSVLAQFETMIQKKRDELNEVTMKRDYFLKQFGRFFNVAAEAVTID
jgi:hypothetical protein